MLLKLLYLFGVIPFLQPPVHLHPKGGSLPLPVEAKAVDVAIIGDSLSVYVFLEDECTISQFYTNELTRLYEKYKLQHVGFIGIFPSKSTGPEAIEVFAHDFKLDFPMFPDNNKDVTKKLGAHVTPEAVAWDHRDDRIIYRGRIDDSYVRVGKRKLHPQQHDLEDIIQAWTLNQTPEIMVETQAIGCFITFE